MKEEKNQKKIPLQIPSLWRFNPVVLVLLPQKSGFISLVEHAEHMVGLILACFLL